MREMMHWRDMALDVTHQDCDRLLSPWGWILRGRHFVPVAMTSFGDWFLEADDGAIHFLDAIAGELKPVAASRTEFEEKAGLQRNLDEWFMAGLVLLLRERGIHPKEGECYGYKLPPAVGGKLEVENIEVTDLMIHQAILGQILEQNRKLSPGARIARFTEE
ncbi:MAG: DUF1851 domain-containing protein [Planctomycetes bacterium]|nr:DUF1851 domain-containing protein [Planctomycetota bacterium]